MNTQSVFKPIQLKTLCALLVTSVVLVGCGSGSNKRENTPSSSSVSSAVSSVAVSSEAASSEAVSSEAAVSSAASSMPSTDLSFGFADGIEGWYVNGDGMNLLLEHDVDAAALSITPLAWTDAENWKRQVRTNLDPAVNMEGATVTMVVNIPQAYITDAAIALQIIIQQGEGATNDNYLTVPQLTAGDNTIVWAPGDDKATDGITSIGLQLSVPPTDTDIVDPILIKSLLIEFAEGSSSSESSASSEASTSSESSAAAGTLSVNFDGDTVGTVYEVSSWAPEDITATVVSIASVTGLPANGASTNVLKVSVANYNALPLFDLTLPEGTTLDDYDVVIDAYLPRSTLGLTENEDNFYKPMILAAGTEVTSGVNDENAAYHSQIDTAGNVDAWLPFTLTVDATKGALLSGAIKIGVGVSRPVGAGEASAYYIDNVRLVAK